MNSKFRLTWKFNYISIIQTPHPLTWNSLKLLLKNTSPSFSNSRSTLEVIILPVGLMPVKWKLAKLDLDMPNCSAPCFASTVTCVTGMRERNWKNANSNISKASDMKWYNKAPHIYRCNYNIIGVKNQIDLLWMLFHFLSSVFIYVDKSKRYRLCCSILIPTFFV